MTNYNDSEVRCWIETEDYHRDGEFIFTGFVIQRESHLRDGSWKLYEASRCGTGRCHDKDPNVLWAYIQSQGWQFVPELSDWQPPSST